MYLELTPQDTRKDLTHLLLDSLPGFEFPRQNIEDYTIDVAEIAASEISEDDFVLGSVWGELDEDEDPSRVLIDTSYFSATLSSEEINIIAILMMNEWLQRQITSIENIRQKYSGSDFKMTSQANHLDKLLKLQEECRRQSHHMQRLYKRRIKNDDGIYKSTWDWFGSHGVHQ